MLVAGALVALLLFRGAGRDLPVPFAEPEATGGAPARSAPALTPASTPAALEEDPADAAGRDAPGREPAHVAGARPVHGRALEATTGQPLGEAFALDLRADGRRERIAPDAAGRFRGETAFAPGTILAGLFERHEGWTLAGERFEHGADDAALELRFEVGLLVHLALLFPGDERPQSMRARVLVTDPEADEPHAWDWDTLRPMPDACVHYKKPRPVDALASLALEVEAKAGEETWRGSVALPAARGLVGPLTLTLVADTSVVGRVVDPRGEPVVEASVVLLPEAQGARKGIEILDRTNQDGDFRFDRVEPGAVRLTVHHGLTASPPLSVRVHEGRNDLGTLVLEVPPGASFVRGRVLGLDRGVPLIPLVLENTASGQRWYAGTDFDIFGGSTSGGEFAFESVPPGDYELRPVADLQVTFVPDHLRVSPPVEGLRFEIDPGPLPRAVLVEARDARTGAALAKLQFASRMDGLWFGGGGLETGRPVPAIGDRWILWATGYRPATVERPPDARFEPTTIDGERVALARIEVALEPGWTRVLVAIDGDRPRGTMNGEFEPYYGARLEGVEVSAAGRVLARTDGDGLALVVSDGDPGGLDFRLAGWRVLLVRPAGEFLMVVLGRG